MFLSEYLAFCETNKYEVLSYLMRNIVFVGKTMRTSFLEEILQGSYLAAIREAYGQYLHRYDQTLASLLFDELTTTKRNREEREALEELLEEIETCKEHGERIILCQPMYVYFNGQAEYRSRTVMLTNLGMYILRDPDATSGAAGHDGAGR